MQAKMPSYASRRRRASRRHTARATAGAMRARGAITADYAADRELIKTLFKLHRGLTMVTLYNTAPEHVVVDGTDSKKIIVDLLASMVDDIDGLLEQFD